MADKTINASEITPESLYLNRRNFIRAGLLASTSLATGLTYRFFNPPPPTELVTSSIENVRLGQNGVTRETPNTVEEITNYNNFYQFSSTDKAAVARQARDFVTRPLTPA